MSQQLKRLSQLVVTLAAVVTAFAATIARAQEASDASPAEYRAHIVLCGDSTVTDDAGWGAGFAACVGDGIKCTNLSRGGRSSSSFRDDGHWAEALALKPDWILIQFGHNDEPGHPGRENQPEEGYRTNITRYVDEAIAAGALPVLVTPISRRQWGRTDNDRDRIVSSLAPYAAVVRDIARTKDVPLIDLHDRSIEVYQSLTPRGCEMITTRKENGDWDGTHMNRAGANMFGPLVAMDCRGTIPGMSQFFPTSKLMQLQSSERAPSMSDEGEGGLRDRGDGDAAAEPTFQGERTLTVARDGTGNYRTLQEAIAAVPDNNADRTTIRIQPGVHMGQMVVPRSKPNITFLGADRETSIISYALSVHDPVPPGVRRDLAGYGVVILADGFRAANLTIRQLSGDHGQAIALRIDGDRAIVRDCNLLGWQDTVRLERGRHYLRDCYIEGRVDYIYGGATALLESCTCHTKNDGYITAASTDRDQAWGYVFLNCKLTGTRKDSVFLGRPWRPFASVTYVNCEMDESIRPIGWDNWRNPENEETARYYEVGSTGPGANPSARAPWSHQLTETEADEITPAEILAGNDNWDAVADCNATTP
jgi:pectinesterase